MTPKRVIPFKRALAKWYRTHQRALPWRETDDPYRIWVSEVMLQQTQVKTVLPYYERFLAAYPSVERLAETPLESLLKTWEGLGYYARARNLHRAAQLVVKGHNGRVPDNPASFRTLPGVGDYIAAAVQSIAFGHPMAVVDGNVKRVIARLITLETPSNASGPSAKSEYEGWADRLLDTSRPGDHNQAMMELGALVCTPRQPTCGTCPVRSFCTAFKQHKVDQYPKRIARKPVPHHHIAVGVVYKRGRMLITKRKPGGLLGGLFEFPGGKIEAGESPQAACVREIREEVDLEVTVRRHLTTVRHAYTHFKITMEVYLCDFVSGEVRLNGPAAFKWVTRNDLANYAFPKANNKFIPMLGESGR